MLLFWASGTETKIATHDQAASWRSFALCATSAFRLTTVLSKSVGQRVVRACPDAAEILGAAAPADNGTKVIGE